MAHLATPTNNPGMSSPVPSVPAGEEGSDIQPQHLGPTITHRTAQQALGHKSHPATSLPKPTLRGRIASCLTQVSRGLRFLAIAELISTVGAAVFAGISSPVTLGFGTALVATFLTHTIITNYIQKRVSHRASHA